MRVVYSAGIWIEDSRIKDGRVSALPQASAREFQEITRKSLDAIRATPVGAQMLNEIDRSNHRVSIYRVWSKNDGNYQGGGDPGGDEMVVPLDRKMADGRLQLAHVLDTSSQRFLKRDAVARLLNVDVRDLAAMEAGTRAIDANTDARLRAYLYDFMTPGVGADCHVGFNHKRLSISEEHKRHLPASEYFKNRPVPVALAHELVHAWRVVVGRVLYRYGWEEEAMTVGLPPYSTMKYTENRFRVEFGGLAIRPDYEYREFTTGIIDAKQAGIDPVTKAWQGQPGSLAASNQEVIQSSMAKRRAAMGYDDDFDD